MESSHKLLVEFLKKKRLTRKFKKNCNIAFEKADTISGSFTWAQSTEGHKFWEKVHSEYFKYCKNKE